MLKWIDTFFPESVKVHGLLVFSSIKNALVPWIKNSICKFELSISFDGITS